MWLLVGFSPLNRRLLQYRRANGHSRLESTVRCCRHRGAGWGMFSTVVVSGWRFAGGRGSPPVTGSPCLTDSYGPLSPVLVNFHPARLQGLDCARIAGGLAAAAPQARGLVNRPDPCSQFYRDSSGPGRSPGRSVSRATAYRAVV